MSRVGGQEPGPVAGGAPAGRSGRDGRGRVPDTWVHPRACPCPPLQGPGLRVPRFPLSSAATAEQWPRGTVYTRAGLSAWVPWAGSGAGGSVQGGGLGPRHLGSSLARGGRQGPVAALSQPRAWMPLSHPGGGTFLPPWSVSRAACPPRSSLLPPGARSGLPAPHPPRRPNPLSRGLGEAPSTAGEPGRRGSAPRPGAGGTGPSRGGRLDAWVLFPAGNDCPVGQTQQG